jgi:hypothetical protein
MYWHERSIATHRFPDARWSSFSNICKLLLNPSRTESARLGYLQRSGDPFLILGDVKRNAHPSKYLSFQPMLFLFFPPRRTLHPPPPRLNFTLRPSASTSSLAPPSSSPTSSPSASRSPRRPEATSCFTSLFHGTPATLFVHRVEIGEEVLQIPHLTLAGVGGSAGTQLLSARCGRRRRLGAALSLSLSSLF